jgi:hypothetical protein
LGQETITTRGVEELRWLTYMGSGWDWRGKDCDYAEDGNGIWETSPFIGKG